ncbi:hypothetical protein BH24PSE2_BH24PSE2_21840 [soil metagenome]
MLQIRRFGWCAAAGVAVVALALGTPAVGADQAPEWVSPGKPSAPVEMTYRLLTKPEAGMPLDVDVSLSSRVQADVLTIEYGFPDAALTAVTASKTESIHDPGAGVQYRRSLRVLPRDEGQFHINVVVTLVRAGVPQSRAFSIPVRVGLQAVEVRGLLKTDGTGRPIISLPAREFGDIPH